MPNLFASLPAWFRGDGNGGRRGAWYVVVGSLALALVFGVLVATVSVWKAFLFAGMALTTLGVAECLASAPESGVVGAAEHGTSAGVPRTACRFGGLGKGTVDSLPTFAYASGGAEADGDLECGSGGHPCSVCLEDLDDGEMVRRLPPCNHIFHVGCIDMWLHSHTTCPVCRCDLSPQRACTAKKAAVVEMGRPAQPIV